MRDNEIKKIEDLENMELSDDAMERVFKTLKDDVRSKNLREQVVRTAQAFNMTWKNDLKVGKHQSFSKHKYRIIKLIKDKG